MSDTCCVWKGLFGRTLSLTLLTATAALALTLFVPWRAMDAAAPVGADDPLLQGRFVPPVPSALENAGVKNADNDAELLMHWQYTKIPASQT